MFTVGLLGTPMVLEWTKDDSSVKHMWSWPEKALESHYFLRVYPVCHAEGVELGPAWQSLHCY